MEKVEDKRHGWTVLKIWRVKNWYENSKWPSQRQIWIETNSLQLHRVKELTDGEKMKKNGLDTDRSRGCCKDERYVGRGPWQGRAGRTSGKCRRQWTAPAAACHRRRRGPRRRGTTRRTPGSADRRPPSSDDSRPTDYPDAAPTRRTRSTRSWRRSADWPSWKVSSRAARRCRRRRRRANPCRLCERGTEAGDRGSAPSLDRRRLRRPSEFSSPEKKTRRRISVGRGWLVPPSQRPAHRRRRSDTQLPSYPCHIDDWTTRDSWGDWQTSRFLSSRATPAPRIL